MKAAQSIDPEVIYATGPWIHRNVSAGGMRFHIAELGDPTPTSPTVLLLHGFPQFWRAWIPVLNELHKHGNIPHIIAADLRGCGGTDKQPHGYTLGSLSADCVSLLSACGVTQCLVVGHDIGGQIGWLMAHSEPTLVRGLIAIAAPHPLQLQRFSAVLSTQNIVHRATVSLPYFANKFATNGKLVKKTIQRWSHPRHAAALLAASTPYIEVLKMPRAAYGMLAHARRPTHLPTAIKERLKTPVNGVVVTVIGDSDPVFPASTYAYDATHTTHGIRQLVFAHCGHFVPEEAPKQLADVISETYQTL